MGLARRDRLPRVAVAVEDMVQRLLVAVLGLLGRHRVLIIPFVGHGTPHRARIGARVVHGRPAAAVPAATPASPAPGGPGTSPGMTPTPRSPWATLRASLGRFLTVELPHAVVTIHLPGGPTTAVADREGYLDTAVDLPGLAPGWHRLTLSVRHRGAVVTAPAELLVVDPRSRIAVVSDIDDTVLETGLTRGLAFLRASLLTDVADRTPLPGAAALYRALVAAPDGVARPVFYLSTSPWNLHELLLQFVRLRGFPPGPLLLTDWGPGAHGLFRIGAREHKLTLLRRLLAEHPALDVVLVGDSGQLDPEIYAAVAEESPRRVRAVYIRQTPSVGPGRSRAVDALAARVGALGVPMLSVRDSVRIAEHAVSVRLLDPSTVDAVRAETEAS